MWTFSFQRQRVRSDIWLVILHQVSSNYLQTLGQSFILKKIQDSSTAREYDLSVQWLPAPVVENTSAINGKSLDCPWRTTFNWTYPSLHLPSVIGTVTESFIMPHEHRTYFFVNNQCSLLLFCTLRCVFGTLTNFQFQPKFKRLGLHVHIIPEQSSSNIVHWQKWN